MRLVPAQFAIDCRDGYDDALTVRPGGIAVQRDIFGRLESRHTGLVAFERLIVDVFKVALDLGHALFIGDRAMTGNDGLHVHLQDAVAGPQPVAHRPGPHDGVATNEEDIARENNTVVRNVCQRVTTRVRRADLDEMYRLISYLQRHFALEGLARQRQRDIFKVEGAEDVDAIHTKLPHCRGLLEEHSKLRGLYALDHLIDSLLRSDDLR